MSDLKTSRNTHQHTGCVPDRQPDIALGNPTDGMLHVRLCCRSALKPNPRDVYGAAGATVDLERGSPVWAMRTPTLEN
jgi:hypothetical protein